MFYLSLFHGLFIQPLFCETTVYIFTLIKISAWILYVRNHKATSPKQPQNRPIPTIKNIPIISMTTVLGNTEMGKG
jgi:hypothetical protein